jgi:hypothetical protein
MVVRRRWHQNPNLVSPKIFNLCMHNIDPVKIRKIVSYIMGLRRGNKGRVRNVGHLMIPRAGDSLMKLTNHILRRVITLHMAWSITRGGSLPFNSRLNSSRLSTL